MRSIHRLPALLVLLLLAACADSVGPGALLGEWVQRVESERGPWNSHEIRLELRADGSYTWGSTAHAEWGRPGDRLLGYTRQHGTYEVAGDSLFLTARRMETWDYLTGGPFETGISGQPTARYHARVVTNRLILRFISYPLDAPEETHMVLRRD